MSKLGKEGKSKNKSGSKPPKIIVFMFWAFAIFAGFNLVSDFSLANPLGQIGKVLAQVTNRPAPNTGTITRILQGYQRVEGEPQITDTYDRCLVIDPNLGGTARQVKNIGSRSNAALGENLGGLNNPFVLDWPDFATTEEYQQSMTLAEEFGMSYVLGLTTKPTTADIVAQFVNEATDRGFVPVVRLCVVGACEFDLSNGPGQLVDFYRDVSRLSTGEFIAILGPNEPGTGNPLEIEGFGLSIDQYPQLVQTSIQAANELQSLRVLNGGNMYLAPAAFNITNPINDDAKLYFENGLEGATDLFDVLLINSYDLPGGTSYSFYENTAGGFPLKSTVDGSELAVVVTEFGSFVEGTGSNFDQLKESFDLYCQDENVEGVLFFRSVESLAGFYPPGDENARPPGLISDEVLEDMLSGCAKGSLRDYAWVDCNFDTCLYEETYDPRSTARVCGVENPEPRTELTAPALAIICEENRCKTLPHNSIQVLMPIKQFGSNSWTGTPNFNYPPSCAEIAHLYPNEEIDALNQFAGLLLSDGQINQSGQPDGGIQYPMPWLGSAINCTSELIKMTLEWQDNLGSTINFSPSPGSYYTETKKEVAFEIENEFLKEKEITVPGDIAEKVLSGGQEQPGFITDERAICLDDVCEDKETIVFSPQYYGEYIPARLAQNYNKPEACTASDLLIRQEPNNYIYGPEIWLSPGRAEYAGSAAEACINYARRNTEFADPRYLYDRDAKVYCVIPVFQMEELELTIDDIPEECRPGGEAYQALLGLRRRTCLNEFDDNGDYHEGFCGEESPDFGLIDRCIGIDPVSRGHYFITPNAFDTNLPSFDIPGIYDSLYNMYERTQDVMSRRNLKIVFRENFGWRGIVENKVRDQGRPFDRFKPLLFNQNHSPDTCSTNVDYVGGVVHLAKNNPIQRKELYYDWLGYLDVMQEWIMVYARDNYGTAEQVKENPLLTPEFSDIEIPPQLDKDYIILSGTASQNTRFPIWTCDEVEFRKLGIKFVDGEPVRVNQYETFEDNFNPTCVDWISSDSYNDGLEDFLCAKNPNAYSELCAPDDEDPGDLVCRTPDGEIIEPGDLGDGVTCPMRGGYCLQGPAGGSSSHRALNALDIWNRTDNMLVAPFDGRVTGIIGNHCATRSLHGGDGIIYEGTVGGVDYRLMLYHLNLVDSDVVVGKEYLATQEIAPLADDGGNSNSRPRTPVLDIAPYSRGNPSTIFTVEGQRPPASSELTSSLSCTTNRFTDNRHVHIEVLNNRNIDIYGFGLALGCGPGDNASCNASAAESSGSIGTFPEAEELICEYEDGGEDEIPAGEGPTTGCNEFNCAMGAGWTENFAGSLECASNTLRNNIYGNGRRRHSLAELLDSYGPYCDTVTVRIGSNGKSTMPYLNNVFREIYDPYAFVKRKDSSGNVCSTLPPDTPRREDVGMPCPSLPARKEGIYEERWDYYVGALESCTLTFDEMSWDGSVEGRSVEEVTQYLIDNISYYGITLDEDEQFGVPREKVELLVEVSQSKGINPFLLVANWATESAFGTYWDPDHACNVY